MDSGNGPNQQQRYCPTPIMAPPSVAASPPIMTGGNVMSALHQPTHHPPPSISPHPGAYYAHHTTGTSHYPTPSPTPPPPHMHQQYYAHAHSYYAHGSHQQAQQQQQQQTQQSQHHAISNAHVPINTSPGAAQPTSQHSQHLMGHGAYHHPQSQAHHQQWVAPSHPLQQQSHHYYHQPTHHSPSPQQQQQQQQTQQHGYPPPPHSPYPYVQPHAPAPTPPPPPHTPHAQQQQHLQQTTQPQQQHQHSPQVSVSPSPGQIHQTSPQQQQQQQQPQSHALMNLSRFVSQQQSPSPSPRASPNLAVSHHPQQQMSQMGPTSPSPFGGGHLEHHSMNGHTSNPGANNSPPVMSPPPAPVSNQQPMSPTPTSPVSQHPMIIPSQIPHNINGGEMLDRRSPANHSNMMGSGDERDNATGNGIMMKPDTSSNPSNKERDIPSVFSNITPSKIASMMNLKKNSSSSSNTSASVPKSSNSNTPISSQNSAPSVSDVEISNVGESNYPGISNASPLQMDTLQDERLRTPEIPKDLGDSSATTSNERATCSPSKQMGSPSSSGNGHQMMPVRLQNMHKGARTKANMKKLMQEQQITTPNGQGTDINSDMNVSVKESEVLDLVAQKQVSEKPAKSSRKKKAQKDSISSVTSNDSLVPMSPINMDLIGPGNSSASVTPAVVVRPGYTKSGKKIGRPRKDAGQAGQPAAVKPKKKRESKSTPKKTKNSPQVVPELPTPVDIPMDDPVFDVFSLDAEVNEVSTVPEAASSIKRKATKTSRKRSSKLSSEIVDVKELPPVETPSDLISSPPLHDEQLPPTEASLNESLPRKNSGKKKRSKKSAANVSNNSNSTDSPPPDSSVLNSIEGSKISEQEAESVALRVIQPSTPITTKGKRNGKKSAIVAPTPEPEAEIITNVRRSKGGKKKSTPAVVAKELIVSPERGELPRLRSRSPKQRESPPLRISSPRAAKERSTTPAASTSQASTSRSRASKEKETGSTVTTPLSSPSLRSPKKSPEKDKTAIRSSSRQKANEALIAETPEAQKEVISPPLTKRSRQVSKELLDSADIPKKGRRKPAASEVRLSGDSDISPPVIVSKRASRRKSGSVTGSTDNLSSPSFNPISSSLSHIPSDGSLEMPSDFSVSTSADNTAPVVDQQNLLNEIPTSVPVPSKRRKAKKIGKKSKSQRSSVENSYAILPAETEPAAIIQAAPEPSLLLEESAKVPAVKIKTKKSRKASGKKGKRRSSTTTVTISTPAESTLGESLGESNDQSMLHVPSMTLVVKPKGRKGMGRPKKQKSFPNNSTDILNIPIPVPDLVSVTKKNVKFAKTRKQSKKGVAKTAEASDTSADGNASIESINASRTTGESLEGGLTQDITPPKRRRSSVGSTNTQVSAKLNTQNETMVFPKSKSPPTACTSGTSPSNASKAQRRDSRSVSRDYDVSVVLTDIVQTFTQGDTSLLGISTSLSRLQSPPTTPFTPCQPLQSPPEPTTSVNSVKEEVETLETTSRTKKRKRLTKNKSDGPPKKKLKGVQQNQTKEFQTRKAELEKEVAQVLLALKDSSKSPSPAKSIPGGSGDSQEVAPKKKGKGQKRTSSKSPRRSVDNAAVLQDSAFHSVLTPEADTFTTLQAAPKGIKRKGSKARRYSNAKKPRMPSSFLSQSTDGDVNSPNYSTDLVPSLEASPIPQSSPVKVAKTASIPTASSLGIIDSPVAPIKIKSKKKTPTKGKIPKTVMTSPDITAPLPSSSTVGLPSPSTLALPSSSSLSFPSPSAVAVPKRKRKQLKKESETPLQTSNLLPDLTFEACLKVDVPVNHAPMTENLPSTSITEGSPKKKRQRKAKTSIEAAVPSTSAAALVDQLPSTSKLFPRISPTPYKKPTVFSKSVPISDGAKDDDNQKKRAQEAPSLKVLWGRSRFYRGGEVDEVDPDPKLPKEKTQLQTDNAVPWICSLCHLGPHAQKLGDLFGPYFANLPSIYGNPSSKRETWIHGDCAVWAGRLLLIGTYLRRLEETLTNSDKETCTVCGKNGATIGCLRRGCKEAVHYPCALRKFWKMDSQNFHSYCPNHIP